MWAAYESRQRIAADGLMHSQRDWVPVTSRPRGAALAFSADGSGT
jgi:hypothetical protein